MDELTVFDDMLYAAYYYKDGRKWYATLCISKTKDDEYSQHITVKAIDNHFDSQSITGIEYCGYIIQEKWSDKLQHDYEKMHKLIVGYIEQMVNSPKPKISFGLLGE